MIFALLAKIDQILNWNPSILILSIVYMLMEFLQKINAFHFVKQLTTQMPPAQPKHAMSHLY